jgi:SH3-like domain-containing protein
MKRLVLLAGLILFALAGCGSGETEPPPTPIPTVTLAPLPTLTPIPTSTPTLPQVTVQVKAEQVNCRSGPGTVFVLVSEIRQGRVLQAVGRNDSATWWYVRDPGNPGGFCWVSADVTETQGEAEALPIVQPPVAAITDLNLRVEPNRILVQCDQFPQTVFFEAQVTTNGPTLLTWKWEVSNGAVSNVGSLIFESAGTQVINEYYQINAPNEYWVKLYILTPTELVQQITFPVNCTP